MRRLALLVLLAFLVAGAAGAVADGDKGSKGKGGDREGDGKDDDGRGEVREPDDHRGEEDDGGRGEGDRGRKAKDRVQRDEAPRVEVALTGDAAVRQSPRTDPGRLSYVLLVGGLGPAVARGVSMQADLPDLGGDWTLAGAGSAACEVDGLRLHCSFGDMAPGDLRLLEVSSAVHLPPAWEVKTTAVLEAGNDGRPGNDSATSVVGILLT